MTAAFQIVAVRLADNRVRFVEGDAVTARPEHATRFADPAKAEAAARRWAGRTGIKEAWLLEGVASGR